MAASNNCFVVSNTVHYMHGSLPFLTALSGEATTANATVLITSPDYLGSLFDLYVRSLSWGLFIILLFVIIFLITSLLLACVYFCCFKKTDQEQNPTNNERRCLKWSCGAFTLACGMCSLVILCLGFWFESTLNKVLLSHALPSSVKNETIRHWIVTCVLVIAMVCLSTTLVGFLVLLICKAGKCYTMMLVVSLSLVTALITPLVGVGISLLSFTSAFCEEFSGTSNCSSPVAVAWSDICTGAFQDGFILLTLGCGLLVFVSFGQCSGAVFSQLFLSHIKRSTRVDSSVHDLDQPDELLMLSSTTDRRLPTAPPPMVPPGAFVGIGGEDRYLTTDQATGAHIPRRRQTMPAYTSQPAEPPPLYDDLCLNQSTWLTGTHEPASGNSGTVTENTTGTGFGADAAAVRTGDDQAEYDTPL